MPPNDGQAQQERVKKIAESYEGSEKREVAELYIERVARLKSAIMNSKLPDYEKKERLENVDKYLKLVDANNIERLRKQFEPIFKNMEETLTPEVKEKGVDVREAKLEGVSESVQEQLRKEWKEAKTVQTTFETRKARIAQTIKDKKLDPDGTELEYYMTSMAFYSQFMGSKFEDFNKASSAGDKHKHAQDVIDQGKTYSMVLEEVEKRLRTVSHQNELRVISLEDSAEFSAQMMLLKQKKFNESKESLMAQLDAMKVPQNAELRVKLTKLFKDADIQFDALKEATFKAKTPEVRKATALQAINLLDKAISHIQEGSDGLKKRDVDSTIDRMWTLTKITEEIPAFKKMLGAAFLLPQFAVGWGYYDAAKKGDSTVDTALEVADFGISLVPFVGGVYDVGIAIRGEAPSGRKLGNVERGVRAGIGVASVVVDFFSFGVGGSLVKVGGKTAFKAGAELTAKATAKAALEAGGKAASKEAAELAAKTAAEAAAKDTGNAALKAAADAAEKTAEEAAKKVNIVLTKEQQEIIAKATAEGATMAQKSAARAELTEVIMKSMEPFAKELGEKYAQKVAQQAATVATRSTEGFSGKVFGIASNITGGRIGAAGMKGLEEGIVKAGGEKAAIEAAHAAGKEAFAGYYVGAEYVKNGEILWKQSFKDSAKEGGALLWKMHNPMELLRTLASPLGFARRALRMAPEELANIERSTKASLMADGHNAKEVEALFADVKNKPFDQFMKDHKDSKILQDAEGEAFFKDFSQMIPRSRLSELGAFNDVRKSLFGMLPDDKIVATQMSLDSRKLTWQQFETKYKDNLAVVGRKNPDQIKKLQEQMEGMQMLNPSMPANLARKEASKDAVRLGEAEVVKLRTELETLQKQREAFQKEFAEMTEAGYKKLLEGQAAAGKELTTQQKNKIVHDFVEALPDGVVKKSIQDSRDVVVATLPKRYKNPGSDKFQEETAKAFDRHLDDQFKKLKKFDQDIASKTVLLEQAGVNVSTLRSKAEGKPSLPQKEDVVIQGEKAHKESSDIFATSREAKKESIKKFEQELKELKAENKTLEDFSKQFEKIFGKDQAGLIGPIAQNRQWEIWFETFEKLPKGALKKKIEDVRDASTTLPKATDPDYKQKMGELVEQYVSGRKTDLIAAIGQKNNDIKNLEQQIKGGGTATAGTPPVGAAPATP